MVITAVVLLQNCVSELTFVFFKFIGKKTSISLFDIRDDRK